jgi:hypothetical protein
MVVGNETSKGGNNRVIDLARTTPIRITRLMVWTNDMKSTFTFSCDVLVRVTGGLSSFIESKME